MAGKKVNFGTKPKKQPDVDAWVDNREEHQDEVAKESESGNQPAKESKAKSKKSEELDNNGAMKRLTLDIPEKLHRRIKGKAVMEGVTMVNMLRELLEENYG